MSHRRGIVSLAMLLVLVAPGMPSRAASPGPTPGASPSPSGSPGQGEPRELQPLLPGPVVGPGDYFYRGMGLDIAFTVPAGWQAQSLSSDAGFMLVPDGQAAALTVTAFIGRAYEDPCDPLTLGDIDRTAAAFIELLAGNRYLEVGEPRDAQVDGTAGLEVDLTVPTPGEGACPTEQPWLWLWAPSDTVDFHLDDGEQARVIALDRDGRAIVIVAEAFPGVDYDPFLETAMSVVGSMTLDPAPVVLPPTMA